MLKKIFCYLLLCCSILITSCVPYNIEKTSDMTEPDFTPAKSKHFVYQNDFYYDNGGLLYYCDLNYLNEIETYSRCLCFDPLCEHNSSACMGYTGSGDVKICLRTIDGTPRLFVLYLNFMTNPSTYEIAQYDISNAQKNILVKGIPNIINNFIVTDDYIIFDEYEQDSNSIRVYSFDENAYFELQNDRNAIYRLIGCVGNTIYYNDELHNVYSYSIQSEQEKKLMTGVLPYGYIIHDDYLYFPSNVNSQELNGMSFHSVDISRTALGSLSRQNAAVVAKNVCCYGHVSSYIFDDILYYLPCIPSYIGEAKKSYDGMSEMTFSIINEHDGTVCALNTQTLTEDEIINDLGYNIYDLIYASSDYIIFFTNASGYRTDIEYNQFNAVYVYDFASQDLYQILYYGI